MRSNFKHLTMSNCVCNKNDACIDCEICKQPAYCSESCEKMGWSIHQADCNVHVTTEHPNLTILMPEDSEESHLVRYLDPKGFVSERLIGPNAHRTADGFGGGAHVETSCRYQVKINDQIIDVEPIFEDHDSRSVRQLAAKTHRSEKAIFHNKNKLRLPLVEDSEILILFFIDGEETTNITAKYTGYDGMVMAEDFKHVQVHMQVEDGELTHLYFYCPLEMITLKQKYLPNTPVPDALMAFKCDATNIDHVSGLVMAMEHKMASGELENMENHFNIINAHRLALEKNHDIVPGPKVNASVHAVTSALWDNYVENVGLGIIDGIVTPKERAAVKKMSDQELIDTLRENIDEAKYQQNTLGNNALHQIAYAKYIITFMRKNNKSGRKYPELTPLEQDLRVLQAGKTQQRLSKMKETKTIKKERKTDLEKDRKRREQQRKVVKNLSPVLDNTDE